MWKSMEGITFAEDGADPLKRNAAQVPSRSKSEFIDEDTVWVRVLNCLVDFH